MFCISILFLQKIDHFEVANILLSHGADTSHDDDENDNENDNGNGNGNFN